MASTIKAINPASGAVVFETTGQTLDDARGIVDRSHAAFLEYRKMSLAQRKEIVFRALEELDSIKDQLAKELSEQMGRPISAAKAEIDTMRKRADFMLDISETALADLPGRSQPGLRHWVSKEPVGPVFIISAWNFPWLITINTLIPALLAGNSVILKPASQTPLTAERLKEAFDKAGLPPNVLQVFHSGSRDALKGTLRMPEIAQICFTGSNGGGVAMRQATVDRIVPINLELGGKDPAFVRADADLKWTAANLVDGAIFNSGQSCCAIERVYVHESVHDELVRYMQQELATYRVGDPADEKTNVGPLINHAAVKAVQAQVDDALSKGASDVTPSNSSFSNLPAVGSFSSPRLLTNVNHTMTVMSEETFGPLLPVMKVKDDEEAVRLMNDSEYGLTASVWTKDVVRGEEISQQLEAGTVFVNGCDNPSPDLVWIGWKNSGLGSTLGPTAFEAFVRSKSHNVKETQG